MTDDIERLKGFLNDKIGQRKKQIHAEHSPPFNPDMELEIDCYEWVLGKIDVNKIPFDRLERTIKATIKDLEKRKDKATVRMIPTIYGQRLKVFNGFCLSYLP